MANILSGLFGGQWSDDPMQQEQMRRGALAAGAAGLDTHGKPAGRILSEMLMGFTGGQDRERGFQMKESEARSNDVYKRALGAKALADAQLDMRKYAAQVWGMQARWAIENGRPVPQPPGWMDGSTAQQAIATAPATGMPGPMAGNGAQDGAISSPVAQPPVLTPQTLPGASGGFSGGVSPGQQSSMPDTGLTKLPGTLGAQPAPYTLPGTLGPQPEPDKLPLMRGDQPHTQPTAAEMLERVRRLAAYGQADPQDVAVARLAQPTDVGGMRYDPLSGKWTAKVGEGQFFGPDNVVRNAPGYVDATAGLAGATEYQKQGAQAAWLRRQEFEKGRGRLAAETGMDDGTVYDQQRLQAAGTMAGNTGVPGGNAATLAEQQRSADLVDVVLPNGATMQMPRAQFDEFNRVAKMAGQPPLTTKLSPAQQRRGETAGTLTTVRQKDGSTGVGFVGDLIPSQPGQLGPAGPAGQPATGQSQPNVVQQTPTTEQQIDAAERDMKRGVRKTTWEQDIKLMGDLMKDAGAESLNAARQNAGLEAAWKDTQVSGKATPLLSAAGGWLASFGLAPARVLKFTNRAERLDSILQDRALLGTMALKGAISNADADRVEKAGGRLANTPDANKFIFAFAMSGNIRMMKRARLLAEGEKAVQEGSASKADVEAYVTGRMQESIFDDPTLPVHQFREFAQ